MRYLAATVLLLLTSCAGRVSSEAIPLQPPAPTLATWKPSVHLADTLLSSGAPAVALQISDEMLLKNPRNVNALVRRSEALTALGQTPEAATAYSTAIEIEPRNCRALMGLGRLRLTQDAAAAEALFARVLDFDPDNSGAMANLGVARDMQGHHAAAQAAYRTALGMAPASIAAQVNLGVSMALSGNADGAVRLLHPLAEPPGATPSIRHDLALALALSGQRDQASTVLGHDLSPDQVRRALDGFEALRL